MGTFGLIATGLGFTAFGAFLGAFLTFLITSMLKHREERRTASAMERELLADALLNILKHDQLRVEIPKMEGAGNVPVFLPYRMSLAALHQAISTGQLRLLPSNKSQRRWRLVAETCESFNGFVDNSELIAVNCLFSPKGLPIIKYRLNQLGDQAKETAMLIDNLLSEIDPAWKEQNI